MSRFDAVGEETSGYLGRTSLPLLPMSMLIHADPSLSFPLVTVPVRGRPNWIRARMAQYRSASSRANSSGVPICSTRVYRQCRRVRA